MEEQGHCNVPEKHPGGLGHWVMNQRHGGKEGGRRCDAEQTQKLEELGFQWRIAGMKLDRWEVRFRELKEFKEEYGHCNVPREYPGGLGHWVGHQRRGGKEGSQCRNAERTQKLEELGFKWVVAEMRSDRWELRFRELKEFKEEHGHCNVPEKHPGGLGHWVMNQRHGGKEGGRRCDAEQAHKLEELGFQWGMAGIKLDRWEARFRELKEFKEEHGHCNVPRKHPGGLGHWVGHQRRGGKEGSQRRDAEQAKKLEELGFQWGIAGTRLDQWELRFKELDEFKEKHGHCNVPARYSGGLGTWVSNLRHRGEEECRRRDVEQARKLEELGFRWDTLKTSNRWEARFQQLREFKEEHGHCDVPWKHPGGLGSWVNTQRKEGSHNAEQAQKTEGVRLPMGRGKDVEPV